MPPGQESLMMIVDYKAVTLRSNPSVSAARTVSDRQTLEEADHAHPFQAMTVLHQHYVGTLGRTVVVNLPTLLNFFFKGLSPFVDPAARDEVRLGFPVLIGQR